MVSSVQAGFQDTIECARRNPRARSRDSAIGREPGGRRRKTPCGAFVGDIHRPHVGAHRGQRKTPRHSPPLHHLGVVVSSRTSTPLPSNQACGVTPGPHDSEEKAAAHWDARLARTTLSAFRRPGTRAESGGYTGTFHQSLLRRWWSHCRIIGL